MICYYRTFIYFYTEIAKPLIHITKQTNKLGVWIEECTKAFNKLKKRLSKAPSLIPPDWTKDFDVYVNASNFAIGSVLSQKNFEGYDKSIYYASRQLSASMKNYSIIERGICRLEYTFLSQSATMRLFLNFGNSL